ncbi:MAG TPA: AAA family ATPase [Candidatus Binataceae bacterium]|jgi:predicted ABC-type ATPase|nr:AAA family ATPase [Candidatus Binataceae bacterium]
MADKPWMWLLAGPNGAGKSTCSALLFNLAGAVTEIVNPDEIARRLVPDAPEKAALQAGRLARRQIDELLRERRSFAVETTLSGQLHLQDINRAKSEDWNVGVVYVGLTSPSLALERVCQRTLMGGHDVPERDVRRRYARSLVNLGEIGLVADALLVFDNSSANLKMLLVANGGQLTFKAALLPAWVKRSLEAIIGSGPRKS